MPNPKSLEIVNGWLVERGAHLADYPAGAAYGSLPYSDAEPLVNLAELPGWPETRSSTIGEVEAAAEALHYVIRGGKDFAEPWAEVTETQRAGYRRDALAVLEAARRLGA